MSGGLRSALVTGSTGFIGSAVVRRLLAEGVAVTCLVRSQSIAKAQHLAPDPRIRIIQYHDFNLESSLASVSAEAVFHLASYGVREGDRDIDELVEGNISILLHLLRATMSWPLRRFLHAGSCSEYAFPRQDSELITESHPIQPQSLYGAAKAASVLFGNALSYEVPFVTLRLFGAFGTAEGPHRLVPYLISRLAENKPVDLTAGEQVRDFLFEDDVAEAFLAAATVEGLKPGEVYNVCSSRPTRIREVGELVADTLGKPRELLHWGKRPYRSGEPMWLVGDNRRFRDATGWAPTTTVQGGIRKMVDYTGSMKAGGKPAYGV